MEKPSVLEKEQGERFKSQIEVVKSEKGKPLDVLITEGDKKVGLKKFIPEGIRLIDSKSEALFTYFPISKQLHFNVKEINSLAGRLGLIHEIGHSIDFRDEKRAQEWQLLKEVRNQLRKIFQPLLELETYKQTSNWKKPEFLAKHLPEILPVIRDNIPQDKLENYVKCLADFERVAWANALKLYRKIKQEEGVDLFAGIKNKEIIQAIEGPLGGYEKFSGQLLPEQQFKLFLIKKFGEEAK